MKNIILLFIICFCCLNGRAQSSYITTIAGYGSSYTGDGTPALTCGIGGNTNMTTDKNGNLLFADAGDIIRKITPTGIISTYSTGRYVTTDIYGNVYVLDSSLIRKTDTSGVITRRAWTGPDIMVVDSIGNIYTFRDTSYLRMSVWGFTTPVSKIIKITPLGVETTIAGSYDTTYHVTEGGPATSICYPWGVSLCFDRVGNLYFVGVWTLYKIDTSGNIHTVASVSDEGRISSDIQNNIYVASYGGGLKVTSAGAISHFVASTIGSASSGDGGPATDANIDMSAGITCDVLGNIYVGDHHDIYSYTIRRITTTYPPSFTGGGAQTLTVCANSSATSINSLLAITDADNAQTETWTVTGAPAHGTLSAVYSATSTGGIITPTGLSYTPATGYSGSDVFTVQVSDGTAIASTTVTVTVDGGPAVAAIAGASSVCAGSNITLTDATAGGTWTSSSTATATVNSSGVVHGISSGTTTISYALSNSCGTTTVPYPVTVIAVPNAGTLSGITSVCRHESTTLVSSGDAGGVWTASNVTATVVGGVVTGGAGSGNDYQTDTITYTVSNSCGTSLAKKAVIIRGIPYRSAGTSSICAGTPQREVFSPAGVVLSAVTAPGCSVVISGSTITISASVATSPNPCITLTYSLANSTATVCHDTATDVYNSSIYPVTLTGPQYVRLGSTITLSLGTTTGFNWTVVPSTSIGFLVAGSVVSSASATGTVTISPTAGGNVGDQAVITAKRTNACKDIDTQKIEIICPTCKPENEIEIETTDVGDIKVFPNPGSGKFTITLPSGSLSSAITITDLTGKIMAAKITAKDNVEFDLSDYPRGVYIVNVTTDNKRYKEKVLIE